MMLADLGADVIKIEPPGGDSTRQMPGAVGADSPSFNAVNRGKRSVVLNLKPAAGTRRASRGWRAASDILVENYRPGVMHALGLDYAALVGDQPAADLCVDFRLRPDRPGTRQGRIRSDRAGRRRDHVDHRRAGRPPVKAGVPITDLGAGLFALDRGFSRRSNTDIAPASGSRSTRRWSTPGVALSVWEATEYFSGSGVPQRWDRRIG